MSEAALDNAPEFPFVQGEGVAARVAGAAARGADAFRLVMEEYDAAQKRHGLLVPLTTVAEALGVSRQRVVTLIDESRLRTVEVTGRRWIVGQSVVDYLTAGPKQTGRPRKLSKVANAVRVGQELSAAAQEVMERG